MMVRTYFNCGDITDWYNTRLTRRIFKIIQERLIYDAMTTEEHDALAEVIVLTDGNINNSKYIITVDTWQEMSKIYGALNVFKDTLDNSPLYTRSMILAE